MSTDTRAAVPIHPANVPTYDGAWSYMHLSPVTGKQLGVIRRQIRRVGDWPTRDGDIALILGAGWEPGTPFERLSRAAASYLIFELDRAWAAIGKGGDDE